MSRIVCFIDKITGTCGTCGLDAMGETIIDCKKCNFMKKFKGKERKHFSWCKWLGECE